jgi:hypothetical protein
MPFIVNQPNLIVVLRRSPMLWNIRIIAALVLALHGFIHLMGTTVYMKLGEIQGFTYKTTLLSGHWDLGINGIRLFGALWIFPGVGFIIAAIAMLMGWGWWQSILIPVALLSLLLTGLDWSIAYAGVCLNILILLLIWWSSRITDWLSL